MNAFVSILVDLHNEGQDDPVNAPLPVAQRIPPYTLRAFAETPAGRLERVFVHGRYADGVQPEQRSAAIIWLDARRRETPGDTPFAGGVDIWTGSEWTPFTNLNGRDMWSGQIRTGDAS
jgi:hypothetical protein